jgi:hypothetical protein
MGDYISCGAVQHFLKYAVCHHVTVENKIIHQHFSLVYSSRITQENIMRTKINTTLTSTIYERIESIGISRGERDAATAALLGGERIAEAILGMAHVLRLLVSIPNLRPAFAH